MGYNCIASGLLTHYHCDNLLISLHAVCYSCATQRCVTILKFVICWVHVLIPIVTPFTTSSWATCIPVFTYMRSIPYVLHPYPIGYFSGVYTCSTFHPLSTCPAGRHALFIRFCKSKSWNTWCYISLLLQQWFFFRTCLELVSRLLQVKDCTSARNICLQFFCSPARSMSSTQKNTLTIMGVSPNFVFHMKY